MRAAFSRWYGIEIDTTGDAFFAAFQRATDAISAVSEIQRSLVRHKWPLDEKVRVRMALHTGEATIKNGDYIGMDVHRAARICSAGHGGQVLLSKSTQSLVERDLPKGISLLDLGLHQLKDLRNPVHIFQIVFPDLQSSFPPLKSIQSHPNNLPIQPTSFVGRTQDMEKVKELLNEGRLVTLTGIGGTGKTRLALEVAQDQLPNFPAGVYFVTLEPLSKVESIPLAIAEAIGFLFHSSSDPKEQLIEHLRQKQVLLVLDNFEHLVDGAGFVSELLQSAPEVKILATSREKLNIQGENHFHVDGMEYPDVVDNLEQVAEFSAVNLFMQSAQRVNPAFKLEEQNFKYIVSICQLLRGIPLGILLAAAWVEILSPKEIVDEIIQSLDFLETEMRDVPERHRSIRAVFDTSWDQLSEVEHEILMKLSVFRGGFTREAAQVVTGASLRQLIGLVNKSLLWRNPVSGRFEFHRVLRQFASEKMKEADKQDEARAAHCSYYTDFMSQCLSRVRGSRQTDTLNEIEIDFENIRQAWYWAVDNKNYSAIDRCAETLYLYCEWLNRYQEGEELFQYARKGLAPQSNEEPQPAWGRVLLPWYDLRTEGRGRLEDKKNIKADAELSLATARKLDDQMTAAHCLVLLGAIAEDEGENVQAITSYEEGLALFPDIGDSFWVTIRTGLCHRRLGQHDESLRAFERSLERGRTLDDKIKIAWSLLNLGETLFVDSYPLDEALIVKIDNHWRESNRLFHQIRSRVGIAWTNTNLSMLSFLRQDFKETKALAQETLRATKEFSYTTYGKNEALGILGSASVFEEDYSSGKQYILQWLSTKPNMQQAMKSISAYCRPAMMVVLLPSVALLLANEGKKEKAVELLSLVYIHPAFPKYFLKNWPSLESFRTTLEAEISQNAYDSAWSRGHKLDFDEAISQLLNSWG